MATSQACVASTAERAADRPGHHLRNNLRTDSRHRFGPGPG